MLLGNPIQGCGRKSSVGVKFEYVGTQGVPKRIRFCGVTKTALKYFPIYLSNAIAGKSTSDWKAGRSEALGDAYRLDPQEQCRSTPRSYAMQYANTGRVVPTSPLLLFFWLIRVIGSRKQSSSSLTPTMVLPKKTIRSF